MNSLKWRSIYKYILLLWTFTWVSIVSRLKFTKAIGFIENAYPHVKRWSLDTPYQNYKNHDFYEKQGYVKVDEIKPVKDIDFWLFEYVKERKF